MTVVPGYLDERCVDPGITRMDEVLVLNNVQYGPLDDTLASSVKFDSMSGALLVTVRLQCRTNNQNQVCPVPYREPGALSVMRLVGFPTTFEILQTYEPTGNEISFRVPYMPEGFHAADWFDTYYGNLETLGDVSKAPASFRGATQVTHSR